MKKITAWILTLASFALVMSSCGASTSQNNTSSPTTTTGQTTPAGASGTTEPSEATASADSSASDPTTVSTPTPTESVTPVPADPMEVLKGKKALFCGDSIVMASTYDTEHAAFYGWPGRIKDQYGMSVGKNVGVDGASVSNCRGNNTVVNQVINNSKTKYDFVILEGGVNDAWDCQSIGSPIQLPASETKVADLDLSTLAGGLEDLLYRTKKLYPDATIGYVINFKMTMRVGYLTEMQEYIDAIKRICEKWGVPYLNLYEDEEFNEAFKKSSRYLADGCHPNSAGYDLIAPYIAQFMADIYGKEYTPFFEPDLTEEQIKEILKGKTAAFFGDSITYAETDSAYDAGYGFAGRISAGYGLGSYKNYAVKDAAVSPKLGENTVLKQVKEAEGGNYDFVVLGGGLTDASNTVSLGVVSKMTAENYDESKLNLKTFAGGLDQLLYETVTRYPNATIVYVVNYKPNPNKATGMAGKMSLYVEAIENACAKWGVACLNLYTNPTFNKTFDITTKTNSTDGILPNSAGYDLLAPVIARFLAETYAAKS